jgi:parallel beta-helix repeat protein
VNNTIADNTIRFVASFYGILLANGADNNTLARNTIAHVEARGIALSFQASSNNITANTIRECKNDGIGLWDTCTANQLVKNRISDCEGEGIFVGLHSDRNNITRNTVFNCSSWGIKLDAASDENRVTWNWFFHNNGSGIQAFDNGVGNVFANNHWNDWVTPDGNPDGLVDKSYPVDVENLALYFDASNNDEVIVPDDASLDLGKNMTVELWVKTTIASATLDRLVGKGVGLRNYGLWIGSTGQILWQILSPGDDAWHA